MAKWPANPTLIGKSFPRLDGMAKASGRAKYPSDMLPDGMLFAVMLYSPHAHAKVKSIDTSAAEKLPGVKAVHVIAKAGATLRYHGDDIAAVAAETEEQARDGVRAIKVEYEVLPHVVTEEQAMASDAPQAFQGGNVRKGRAQTRGNADEAMAKADVVIEGTYTVPVITHVCLEPHGLTARWDGPDKMTVWASTQSVTATAQGLAQNFQIPVGNVHVLTEVMGGGFGSKFGPDVWGITAAELSKKSGKPVRLFLDRIQEHLGAGSRPSSTGKVKLGATKGGKLVAMIVETFGTGGVAAAGAPPLPYVYEVNDNTRTHSAVLVNAGGQRAMRAPNHPQACVVMESAMDDLADKLGIDPLEFRLNNLPDDFKTPLYQAEAAMGAELIGWKENRKPRGKNGKGPIKRGMGMALHTWGGGGQPDKQVSCTINPDGTVELKSATQDIGTGARTILAIIAAEVFGLQPTDIKSNIGDSTFPPGQASGGSTTSPSMCPPAYNGALAARDSFFKRIAEAVQAEPGQMTLKDGKLLIDGVPKMSWKDACRKLPGPLSELGKAGEGLSPRAGGVGGCQFVDLSVDIETGVVTLHKIVAIQDSGLIIDKLTWESQMYGGVIGGLNAGLFEERVMDPTSGVMLNPDMELYKLAGASDIPEIIVRAYEPDDQKARGVIGVGEPATISTCAAIGNAVTNAIGVRVPEWPMTPRNILNALASASKEKA